MFPRPCYITGIFPFSSKPTYRFYKNPWFSRYFPFFTVKKIFLLKTKVIFGISAWNCVRWCMAQNIFEQKTFLEKMRVRATHPPGIFRRKFFFQKNALFSWKWSYEWYMITSEQNKPVSEHKSYMSACLSQKCPLCMD